MYRNLTKNALLNVRSVFPLRKLLSLPVLKWVRSRDLIVQKRKKTFRKNKISWRIIIPTTTFILESDKLLLFSNCIFISGFNKFLNFKGFFLLFLIYHSSWLLSYLTLISDLFSTCFGTGVASWQSPASEERYRKILSNLNYLQPATTCFSPNRMRIVGQK